MAAVTTVLPWRTGFRPAPPPASATVMAAAVPAARPAAITAPRRARRFGRAATRSSPAAADGRAMISLAEIGRAPESMSSRIWSLRLAVIVHSQPGAQVGEPPLRVVLHGCLLDAGQLGHLAQRVSVAVHEHHGHPLPLR